MAKPLRILYAAGPGNVLGTYRHWREGKDDPTQVAITYSGQFYEVCQELNAQTYVIATCRIPGRLADGNFRIVHRAVFAWQPPAPIPLALLPRGRRRPGVGVRPFDRCRRVAFGARAGEEAVQAREQPEPAGEVGGRFRVAADPSSETTVVIEDCVYGDPESAGCHDATSGVHSPLSADR